MSHEGPLEEPGRLYFWVLFCQFIVSHFAAMETHETVYFIIVICILLICGTETLMMKCKWRQ